MKKILFFAITILSTWTSCSDDKELGTDIPFVGSYQLPQGKSPADDRIVELFNKYGSYFLYEYTQEDFNWTQVSFSSNNYTAILGNPAYAGDWLDVIERIWLDFYPTDFLAKNLPYRIFMADSIKRITKSRTFIYEAYRSTNTMAIAGLNEKVGSLSKSAEKSMKNILQQVFADYLVNSHLVEAPDEFYAVSDYAKAAAWAANTDNSPRERGFLPDITDEEQWNYVNDFWCQHSNISRTDDLKHYVTNMVSHAETEEDSWALYLTYPLIKKKHDILQKHFLEKYGIDLQAIGNANARYAE